MQKIESDYFRGDIDGKTILEQLEYACIFDVTRTLDGRFCFTEGCDRHYRAVLTEDQVCLLADELRLLAHQSSDITKP